MNLVHGETNGAKVNQQHMRSVNQKVQKRSAESPEPKTVKRGDRIHMQYAESGGMRIQWRKRRRAERNETAGPHAGERKAMQRTMAKATAHEMRYPAANLVCALATWSCYVMASNASMLGLSGESRQELGPGIGAVPKWRPYG